MAERKTTARKPVRKAAPKTASKARDPLDPPDGLDEHAAKVWREVVDAHREPPNDPRRIIGHELEAYCSTVATLRDVRARVARGSEEVIVADERDRPVPHPAFDLMRQLAREVRDWGDKYTPKTPRPERTLR